MIKSKTDLRNKCIIVPIDLNRKTFDKISNKLKKLGFDNKIVNLQDTRYGISICVNSSYELAWYIGIVDNYTKNLTIEEFLKES